MAANDTHPVDEFANPNGVPDRLLGEAEARLRLLSQRERRNGVGVFYDDVSERWCRDDEAPWA